jgi:anti-sigma B factor antagonist
VPQTPVPAPSTEADQLLSVTAVPGSSGRVVLEVVGEVDTFTAPLLEACLHSQLSRPDLRRLVVDMTRVTFLGVAGVSVLARASHRCRGRGPRLVVRSGGRPAVLRPLLLSRTVDVIALDPEELPARATRRLPRPRRAPSRRPRRVCR